MLPLLALLLLVAPTDTIRNPTVVVVRHAEKASETERDPTLNGVGRARAAALDSALADAHVVAILVTQYRRSVESATLVAARHHITPIVISTDGGVTGHAAAMAKTAKNFDGVVLIIGHSNTVTPIVAALGGPTLPNLCDQSYSQLFTVIPGPAGPSTLRSHFGAGDPPGAASCPAMTPR
jgi:phosphohistidine phosphatase SixA